MELDDWVTLIRDAEGGLAGGDQAEWVRRIDDAVPAPEEALRALVGTCRTGDLLHLAPVLASYWQLSGRASHGHAVLAPLISTVHGAPVAARASATVAVSLLAFRSGMTIEARDSAETALSLARGAANDTVLVRALVQRARVGLRDGDLEAVRSLCREGLDVAARTGDESQRRLPLHCLAEATRLGGDLDAARPLYVESIELNTRLENPGMVAMECSNLAALETAADRPDRAAELLLDAIHYLHATSDLYVLPYALLNAAGVLLAWGQHDDATRLLGAADAIFTRTGMAIDPADRPVFDRHVQAATVALGQHRYSRAFTEGASSDLDVAVDAALAGLARQRSRWPALEQWGNR